MMFLKSFSGRMSRRILPAFRVQQCFSSKKIDVLANELSERINREQLIKTQSEENILKNYIQLTEQSYLEHLLQQMKLAEGKNGKIDPRVILMILPTLENQDSIKEHLLALYPHLNLLQNKELQLFYQYFLAHKFNPKPPIPRSKSVVKAETLLVLLGEIYPKDSLVDWLAQVPIYTGNNLYILAMGAFSIISGLSQSAKLKHQQIIKRSYQRIFELWQQQDSEGRLGVILLGLECGLTFSQKMILEDYSLELENIDGLKLGLFIVELDTFIKKEYQDVHAMEPKQQEEQEQDMEDVEIDEGVDRIERPPPVLRYNYNSENKPEVKYHLQKYLYKLIKHYCTLDWKGIVKLHQMVRFYHVISGKKLEKQWQKFAFKLFNLTTKKETATSLINLSTSDIIGMLEVIESHKVNRPELIKQLLVVLSDRLEEASAEELIRLSKCIITYVRLCEDYLIHFRIILERRKYIFSYEQIQQLNQYFKRVQVLFPKPLVY